MTPVGMYLPVVPPSTPHFATETYTAQATVGDIVKGVTNHKVCFREVVGTVQNIGSKSILESRVVIYGTPRLREWRRWWWAFSPDARKCLSF